MLKVKVKLHQIKQKSFACRVYCKNNNSESQKQITPTGKACANKIVPDQGLFCLISSVDYLLQSRMDPSMSSIGRFHFRNFSTERAKAKQVTMDWPQGDKTFHAQCY